MKKTFVCVWLLGSLLTLTTLGLAQTTATISGVVTDATGAVLSGAQLNVANTATGVKRSATTDAAGRFVTPQLPPGPYEVTVTAPGFETMVRQGITLEIGQEVNLTLPMKVGAVTEQVTVMGEAPLVNTSTSSVSGVVEQQRIEELPLNGRDFSQLPLIQPGVSAVRSGDTVFAKGTGARISMGGSRADQTAWLLDGTNIHSPSFFGTPGGAAGVMLGVDAVREFQVLTSNYSADVGGTSGGVVNMVTKSGTNELHGTAYYGIRNSALDARSFVDIPDKPAFKRNQFGASLGGPIRKDKTFFFGDYEGVIRRLGVSNQPNVPDANVHRGLIPVAGGGLTQVTIAPEIRPYLDLYPLPNGPPVGINSGVATLYFAGNSPVNENYFVTRVDHHINDKQSLFTRFTFDQGDITSPDPIPVTTAKSIIHTRYATVQHDYIASAQLLMSTRIAANRTLLGADEIPLVSYPSSLNIFLPGYLPTLGYTNVTSIGPSTQNLIRHVQNLYDFQENLQYIHGGHVMKFGVSIDHVGSNRRGGSAGLNGSMTWGSVQAFLTDSTPQSFSAAAPGRDNARTYVQYLYGVYFQDDWRMRSNFTWNLGLRYEPFTTPAEKHGRVSTLRDWVKDTTFRTDIGLFGNATKKNFSPRVGFAWDPKGNGRTAIRAGFGAFFAELLSPYYVVQGQKGPPFFSTTQQVQANLNIATAAAYMAQIGPSLLNVVGTPNTLPEITQWDLNPSYEMKYNLAVERQLSGSLSVAAGYLGGRGVHLWRLSAINTAAPVLVNGRPVYVFGSPRVNPSLGQGITRYSDAQSFYNGLQIEVKKRFSRSFQFQTAYTWSKNIDDTTSGVAQTDYREGVQSQPYNPKSDRGLSALHQSHNLVINGVYSIPSPIQSGFLSKVLGGWQISNIFTASSGTPFSVSVSSFSGQDFGGTSNQHPDLVAGRNNGNIVSGTTAGCAGVSAGQKLGTSNLYFDPCAFVLPPTPVGFPAGSRFYGNAGRNILIGPGLLNFDFSLHKSTPLGIREGSRVEFHADAFNLFNRSNFGLPAAVALNNSTRSVIAGVGKITKPTTNSRQLQFGLKLIF